MCKPASPGRYVTLYTAIAFASMTTSLSAAEFGPPPNAELSLDKLSKIDDFINDQVAKGNIPGAVVLIQRHGGRGHFLCFGERAGGAPLRSSSGPVLPL